MTRSLSSSTSRILAPLALGMLLRALQLTVIGPSLINIATSLSASLAEVGWIMALYATGALIAQPIAGQLSDVRGRKTVFIGAVALFAVGSLVCALSTTLVALISGRVLQSLGAGAIQPAATAIIGDNIPAKKQGAALGILFGMFALAAVVGSVVGGALIDGGRAFAERHVLALPVRHELLDYPWHLIFWLNIPLAVATLALGLGLPREQRVARTSKFDAAGAGYLVIIAASLMFAAQAPPPSAIFWLLAAGGGVALFIHNERIAKAPLVDPQLFAARGPALTFLTALVSGIPIFSITMYGAAYYMIAFRASAATAGIAMLAVGVPLGIGLGATGPLINRIGPKKALLAGAVVLVAGDLLMALMREPAGVVVGFAVCGLAMGLVSAPPNVLMYRYVPVERRGAAVGVLAMLASSGAITAPALVTAFLHFGHGDAATIFRAEFLCAFLLAAACPVLIAMLPPPPEAQPHAPANDGGRN